MIIGFAGILLKLHHPDLIDSVPRPQRGDKERLPKITLRILHSNVDAEVEDVATTHDSNVEVHAEPTEPSRVGPIDPSLLTSFKTHIAAAIWNNQEREPLMCMSKTSTLREWNWWGNPNNGIFKWYIQRSGLEHLIRCSYQNADKIVVSTFVERWHPETNTFHMPFGEMTITLDDVSSILGIPMSGTRGLLLPSPP
ncbi:unnamed protein product [Prunus armeniaca]